MYTCNLFFQLPAGDNGIRRCDLTGRWNPTGNWSGTDPVCVTVFTTVTYVCIVLATLTVFILIGEPQTKYNRFFMKCTKLALAVDVEDTKINSATKDTSSGSTGDLIHSSQMLSKLTTLLIVTLTQEGTASADDLDI